MEREIKFRGKSNEGKGWIYGDLVRHLYGMMAIVPAWHNGYQECSDYEVDPDTIGQFTGIYDKEHNEVFENDIVKSRAIDSEYGIFIVKWDKRYASFFIQMADYSEGHPLHSSDSLLVVGNIFDNKELLKKKTSNHGK